LIREEYPGEHGKGSGTATRVWRRETIHVMPARPMNERWDVERHLDVVGRLEPARRDEGFRGPQRRTAEQQDAESVRQRGHQEILVRSDMACRGRLVRHANLDLAPRGI